MKKKNGFTLIELLAVIVILAVIALIAVPQILKILNKTRLSAAEDSTYGIIESAETYVSNFMLQNNGTLPSAELVFDCNGSSCDLQATNLTGYNLDDLKTLEFKGTKPKSGTVTISNNGSNITTTNLVINNFVCGYIGGESICLEKGKTEIKENGSIIYFNPETNKQCNDYVEANSATENKTGCMKWYVFNDSENSMAYNLLLDHNTTATIDSWNNRNIQLANDIVGWNNSLNPRLITVDEINKITGKTDFDSTNASSWYYFDTLNQTNPTTRNYGWLYDRISDCSKHGCLNSPTGKGTWGYWTDTAANSSNAWIVIEYDAVNLYNISDKFRGVRPVITVPKNNIS